MNANVQHTCFVVQGFGSKTDYTDGRVLNLDASYEMIKQAVEEAGLKCIRADEIVHSGTIDVPMYEQLLRADLVIADLSTYNVNAAFELGVRYGLRPYATIVLAEEKFKSPFDVNHIVIRRYKHLGEDIGMHEALRFKTQLKDVIAVILENARVDSPVYSVLSRLTPPQEAALEKLREAQEAAAVAAKQAAVAASQAAAAMGATPGAAAGSLAASAIAPSPPSARATPAFGIARAPVAPVAPAAPAPAAPPSIPMPAPALPADAADSVRNGSAPGASPVAEPAAAAVSPAPSSIPVADVSAAAAPSAGPQPEAAREPAQEPKEEPETPGVSAREWLDRAQQAMKHDDFVAAKTAWAELHKLNPSDNYVTQQLALATYKAKQPSADEALAEARRILETLSPATTNDPETLGLWGAVHKRVWDLHHDPEALAEAIGGYERGFVLKQDHYNGINLAFLLNVRAVESARKGDRDEAGADKVLAQRVRRDVIRYALPQVECPEGSDDDCLDDLEGGDPGSDKQNSRVSAVDRRYWAIASLWEAALGLGDPAGIARWEAEAQKLKVPTWMHETREQQGERLLALQKELDGLLNR